MRSLLISLLKFSMLAALFGPVFALFALLFAPAISAFLFVTLLAIVALVVVIGFLIFGVTKLAGGFKVSSLPRSIQKPVAESRHYGRLIMRVARQYPPGPLRDRLDLTLRPVNLWLENLNRLEQGLAKLYSQRNLERELRQVAFDIDDLRRRSLMAASNEAKFLRELMESKKQHQAALKQLQAFQTQAELKIRKIASDLATTHAEMLLIVARGDFNHNRIHRLDENLQEHLAGLRDMLAAMDDLGYSSATS